MAVYTGRYIVVCQGWRHDDVDKQWVLLTATQGVMNIVNKQTVNYAHSDTGSYEYCQQTNTQSRGLPGCPKQGWKVWAQRGSDFSQMGKIRDVSDQISVHLRTLIWKNPGFVAFVTNLTHVGPKCDIPGSKNPLDRQKIRQIMFLG